MTKIVPECWYPWELSLLHVNLRTLLILLDSFEGDLHAVQVFWVSTQSLDNRISSTTLVITRGREERGKFLLGSYGYPCYGCSRPIYRLWECQFFIKTVIFMSISTNAYWPYVGDHLGLYILLVNDSINQIILIGLLYQLTISIYRLIHWGLI